MRTANGTTSPAFRRAAGFLAACCALGAFGPALAVRPLPAQESSSGLSAEEDTAAVGADDLAAAGLTLRQHVAEMLARAVKAVAEGTPYGGTSLPLRSVTASDAGYLIRYERGHPTVVVIYYASCPRAWVALAYAQELATRYADLGVAVRAFAYDHTAAEIRPYLERLPIMHQPLLLQPWRPGELTAAMRGAGVPLGRSFGQPFVALVGSDGTSLGHWNVTTLAALVAAAQGLDGALAASR